MSQKDKMCCCNIETLELFLTQQHFGKASDCHRDRLEAEVMSFCFLDPLTPWQAQRKNAKNDALNGDNEDKKGKPGGITVLGGSAHLCLGIGFHVQAI